MKKLTLSLVIFFFTLPVLSAEEPAYTNQSFARLSYVTGSTYIQRVADLAYEEAVVNMPVTEGDRVGTTEGRAEIYLGSGTYLRLDHNTKIDFTSLPRRGNDASQVRVWSGNVYFSVKNLDEEKDIEIHTSDVSVYILDPGLYRIDVREDAETEIFVFHGILEAAGESGSVLVKDRQRLEATQGHYASPPTGFMAVAEDSFDRWNEYRDSQIRKRMAQRYLPDELEDFEYELRSYGNWIYVSPYGYVWVPGRVGLDWRPYFNGRWIWHSLSGWTWLPYESWGWAVYHYGRWHWRVGIGWYWIPTRVWGPGWVHWYDGADYWGWAPLSYYGYPGVVIHNVYYDRYSKPHYPYNSRALTVIHKNQLKARNVSKVALSQSSIQKLGKIKLSSNRPRAVSSDQKVSIQKLDKNKVFLHRKEGAASYKPKEQAASSGTRKNASSPRAPDAKLSPKEQKIQPVESRKISKKKTENQSSSSIGPKSSSKSTQSRKPGSIVSRLVKSISGKKSKSVRSPSSGESSQGKSSSRASSGSNSKSSSSRKASSTKSSSKSSSKKTSSSSKVKKK